MKKTERAKFTVDRIRFLMLSLPLAGRDLIAPDVYQRLYIKYHIPYIYHVKSLRI